MCFYPYNIWMTTLKTSPCLYFLSKDCWLIEQDRNNSNENKKTFLIKKCKYFWQYFFQQPDYSLFLYYDLSDNTSLFNSIHPKL